MLMGELSSVLLNSRWLVINSGRGDNKTLMNAINYTFALTFFATRVAGYGAGLAHLWVVRESVLGLESAVARPLLLGVLGLIVGGYGLNLLWMQKIVKVYVAIGVSRPRQVGTPRARCGPAMVPAPCALMPFASRLTHAHRTGRRVAPNQRARTET